MFYSTGQINKIILYSSRLRATYCDDQPSAMPSKYSREVSLPA